MELGWSMEVGETMKNHARMWSIALKYVSEWIKQW